MTRFIVAIVALLLTMSVVANADAIDDGMAICRPHLHHPEAANAWTDPGWEHCLKILGAANARQAAVDAAKQAADAADEAKNPELKKTRDLARKLNEAK